jgi:hypothetical protein
VVRESERECGDNERDAKTRPREVLEGPAAGEVLGTNIDPCCNDHGRAELNCDRRALERESRPGTDAAADRTGDRTNERGMPDP